jgi:hypothetical protein
MWGDNELANTLKYHENETFNFDFDYIFCTC